MGLNAVTVAAGHYFWRHFTFLYQNSSFVDIQYIVKEVKKKRNTLGHSVCTLFQVLAQFSLNTSETDLGFITRKLMFELPHKFSSELSLRILEIRKLEWVRLTRWHQYIFSSSLLFGAYYITGQRGVYIKSMHNAFIYFFDIYIFFVCLFAFHNKTFVFIIFISFFGEVSNFGNRILTNQKCELVVSNCHRNSML